MIFKILLGVEEKRLVQEKNMSKLSIYEASPRFCIPNNGKTVMVFNQGFGPDYT